MKAIRVLCIFLCCVATGGLAQEVSIYGPVKPNETLYRIALDHRHQGMTVAQMMMSIFERNPQAFEQDNINRLRVGSLLQIPSPESVASFDAGNAYQDASQQIDTYESEVRELRVERGELPELGDAAREPDLMPSVAVAGVTSPSDQEIAEMKQTLAQDQTQALPTPSVLPPPKPPQRKKKAEEPTVFRFSYDLAYIHDDNVRLARDDIDIREDNIFSATVKATAGKSIDGFSLLNYGGSVTYNKFETFDTLDNVEFEVNTRYRFALSSGFTSPIYSLKASLGGVEFVDSEMRDSTLLSLSAELNKWLTTTLNMTAGVGFNERDSVSEVFDLSEVRAFVNLDTNFSKTDLVYTTLTLITGDTVSSATPTLDIINVSDAIEPDDAFGGIDANQFAYRIDSDTAVITVGYNRIMTQDLSLDFSVRYVESEAKDDADVYYERTIFRASLLGRF